MNSETKVLLGILGGTLVIILGAVFFFSKSTFNSPIQKVDASILIRSDSEKVSSPSTTVTLVEFGDYQCPACGSYHPLVKQLINEFKDKLTFYFRNFPLNQHKNALVSAYAAEAAGNQGKFWEMHNMIYENQAKWSEENNARDVFIDYAKNLKLDLEKFKKDLDSDAIKQKVQRDRQDGNTLGVSSTPTFYLNSEKLQNPASYDDFKTLVKAAILKAPISQTPAEKYHAHADFKVFVNGKAWDFSAAKYQSNKGKDLNEDIHLHDGNGNLIHLHKKAVTLGEFFKSLKMDFSAACLKTDTGDQYCTTGNTTLKFLVNGKPNDQFEKYQPQDLDRILISFGSENDQELQKQIAAVTDSSCIYSLKCPLRGKPPTENCVGGLGTGCED